MTDEAASIEGIFYGGRDLEERSMSAPLPADGTAGSCRNAECEAFPWLLRGLDVDPPLVEPLGRQDFDAKARQTHIVVVGRGQQAN